MLCLPCTRFDISGLYLIAADRVRTTKPTPSKVGGFATYDGFPYYYRHHESLFALAKSAEEGCALCSAIWQVCSKHVPHDLATGRSSVPPGDFAEPVYLGLTSWSPEAQGMPYLSVVQQLPRDTMRNLATFDVFCNMGGTTWEAERLMSKPVESDPASPSCLKLVKRWHEECLKKHPSCAKLHAKKKILPTRVIDVGSEDSMPRLIATKKAETGVWAALSYCWGGKSPFILTQQTAPSFFGGQTPLHNWPATLHDAIVITRTLHIRYLWIDALCIFQDSPSDWAAEAARMRDVYGGALITICATSSNSTGAGIFKVRDIPPTLCNLPVHNRVGANQVSLRSSSSFSDANQRYESLNTRGWTLQESLLSARTVSYGTQQILWECSAMKIAENGRPVLAGETYRDKTFVQKILADDSTLLERATLKLTKLSLSVMPIGRTLVPSSWEEKADQGYCRWFAIVKDFSARNLTVMADILPALSGVASAFRHLLQDDYVAGLWKADLVRGMCWSRGNLPKRDFRAIKAAQKVSDADGTIPSWSWASVIGGRVGNTMEEEQTWPFIAVLEIASVVDIEYSPLHADPFGKISHACVTLKGPMREVASFRSVASNQSHDHALYERIQAKFTSQTSVDEYDQQHRPRSIQRFCVLRLMMTERSLTSDFTGSIMSLPGASFLLLESTSKTNEWRRVGYMQVSVPMNPDKDDLNVRFLDEMKKNAWERKELHIV